jgi:hypothetical protein
MYSSVAEEASETSNFDTISVASSKRRFGRKRINSELSEPLTTAGTSIVDEELGGSAGDPYFVFRKDLQRKLELVDESLADFLRIVHETVRSFHGHTRSCSGRKWPCHVL